MKLQILVPQIINMPQEEWRDIEDYEGLYAISNYGRIYSAPRKHTKGGIIKQSFSNSGYLQVHLCKNSISKTYQSHRLVAKHFLDNPDNLPEVNHKDERKDNNCVWNLEYCSRIYNQKYGTAIERMAKSHNYKESAIKSAMHHDYKEVAKKQAKRVMQLSDNGEIVKIWDSMRDVARAFNISVSNISSACNGRYKSSCGYQWKVVGEE